MKRIDEELVIGILKSSSDTTQLRQYWDVQRAKQRIQRNREHTLRSKLQRNAINDEFDKCVFPPNTNDQRTAMSEDNGLVCVSIDPRGSVAIDYQPAHRVARQSD